MNYADADRHDAMAGASHAKQWVEGSDGKNA